MMTCPYCKGTEIHFSPGGYCVNVLKQDTDRLLELLREVKKLLDDIYAEDIVSSDDLGKVYEKVAEELGE